MGAHGQFFGQLAAPQDLDSVGGSVGHAGAAKSLFIDQRAFVKTVQVLKINWNIPCTVAGVVKTTQGLNATKG